MSRKTNWVLIAKVVEIVNLCQINVVFFGHKVSSPSMNKQSLHTKAYLPTTDPK